VRDRVGGPGVDTVSEAVEEDEMLTHRLHDNDEGATDVEAERKKDWLSKATATDQPSQAQQQPGAAIEMMPTRSGNTLAVPTASGSSSSVAASRLLAAAANPTFMCHCIRRFSIHSADSHRVDAEGNEIRADLRHVARSAARTSHAITPVCKPRQ